MKEKKASDITVMDVSDLTTLTDYFVICSGNSDTQNKAISDSIEEEVLKQTGEKPWKKEGIQARNWIILDFINIVVHVMSKEKRQFYSIERVWNDARITHIENE
jgi:ribosome-associated protein